MLPTGNKPEKRISCQVSVLSMKFLAKCPWPTANDRQQVPFVGLEQEQSGRKTKFGSRLTFFGSTGGRDGRMQHLRLHWYHTRDGKHIKWQRMVHTWQVRSAQILNEGGLEWSPLPVCCLMFPPYCWKSFIKIFLSFHWLCLFTMLEANYRIKIMKVWSQRNVWAPARTFDRDRNNRKIELTEVYRSTFSCLPVLKTLAKAMF